ncbi:MAG: glutathione transferase GstA [Myxococcota bacterium]|nr:glutathione transferase GstA [Myxococcota bacterium]
MKLYYAPGAGSLATHIVLREAERRFDLERIDLETRRTASGADYLSINPRGVVPALQLDGAGSEILTEGPAILQYVADLAPETRLAPASGTFARYHLQSWLNFLATEIDKQLEPLGSPVTPATYAEHLRSRIGDRFAYLNTVLAHGGFLMGEAFTVADAYLFVLLQWCDKAGIDLAAWPHLDDFEHRVAQRPTVQTAMAAEGLAAGDRWKRSA